MCNLISSSVGVRVRGAELSCEGYFSKYLVSSLWKVNQYFGSSGRYTHTQVFCYIVSQLLAETFNKTLEFQNTF